jgi:hypothetical protein
MSMHVATCGNGLHAEELRDCLHIARELPSECRQLILQQMFGSSNYDGTQVAIIVPGTAFGLVPPVVSQYFR